MDNEPDVMSPEMYFRGHIARFHGCTELDSDEVIFSAVARRDFELSQLRLEVDRLRQAA